MSSVTFIQQLYSRFLGRDADSAGVNYWQQQLDGNSVNAVQATLDFIQSSEFSDTVAPIARLYYATLDRIPDADGLLYWITAYQNGTPISQISNGFMASDEFQSKYGDLSENRDFLNQLYQNVLGRAADSAGIDYWLELMEQGLSRSDVVDGFANSAEFSQAKGADIEILLIYHGILGTQPSQAEIDTAIAEDNHLALISQLYNSEDYSGTTVPGLSTQGVVVDGYVSGATVFIDTNGDGILNPGEVSTTTDALGHFNFGNQGGFGNLVMFGGTDISTGQPFEGTMTAAGGSTVVNPLTTLINAISHSENLTVEQASSLLLDKMGLDSHIDLSSYDPIAAASQDGAPPAEINTALALHAYAVQINNVVSQSAALLDGAGISGDEASAIGAVYEALANSIANTGTLNLNDTTIIQQVITQAGAEAGADSEQSANLESMTEDAAQTIVNINQAIDQAVENSTTSGDALNEIAAVQIVAEEIENEMETGAENGNVGTTTSSSQGSSFDDAINNAASHVGDVDGDGEDDGNGNSNPLPPITGGGSSPPTFNVHHDTTNHIVTFSGTVTGNITIRWEDDIATFSRGGISAATSIDYDPSPKPTITLVSGQTLSTTAAELADIGDMSVAGNGHLILTGESSIADLNGFTHSGVNGSKTYSIGDTATHILANGSGEPLSSANSVSINGGEALGLSIAQHAELLTLTTDDSWDYTISDSATNLLANGSSTPIPNAVGVSVSGGDAGTLSLAQYNALIGITSDDSWAYSLSDDLKTLAAADSVILNNAININATGTGNIAEASALVNTSNSGTTSFHSSYPLSDIAANYAAKDGTLVAGVSALLNSGYTLNPIVSDAATFAQLLAIDAVIGNQELSFNAIADSAANIDTNPNNYLDRQVDVTFTDSATIAQVEAVQSIAVGTVTYALSDATANILNSSHSAIISAATAVSILGGDAGLLSVAQYNQLLALTSDDSWTYSLSDTFANLITVNSSTLTNASSINATGNTSLTDTQHDALPAHLNADGTNLLTLDDAASITTIASVENYSLANLPNQVILSDAGHSIRGGSDTDLLFNGAGVDTLGGEGGDDQFIYTSSSELFSGNTLIDRISGGEGIDAIVIDSSLTSSFNISALDSFASHISGVEKIMVNGIVSQFISLELNDNAFEAGINTIDLSLHTSTWGLNTIDVRAESNSSSGWTILGSMATDNIYAGAGGDSITPGGGSNNIYLAPGSTSTDDNVRDSIIFLDTSGMTRIQNLDLNNDGLTDDQLVIDGALETLLDDNSNTIWETTATDGIDGGNQVLDIAGNDEITLLQISETEIQYSDFTQSGYTNLMAELDEEIDFSSFNHGDTHIFVINTIDTSATSNSAFVYYTDDGGDDSIVAGDIKLLAYSLAQNDPNGLVVSDIVIA